jgi:hypothetical protein
MTTNRGAYRDTLYTGVEEGGQVVGTDAADGEVG